MTLAEADPPLLCAVALGLDPAQAHLDDHDVAEIVEVVDVTGDAGLAVRVVTDPLDGAPLLIVGSARPSRLGTVDEAEHVRALVGWALMRYPCIEVRHDWAGHGSRHPTDDGDGDAMTATEAMADLILDRAPGRPAAPERGT